MGIVVAGREVDLDSCRVDRTRCDILGTALFCAKQQALTATLLALVLIVISYRVIDDNVFARMIRSIIEVPLELRGFTRTYLR
jgi:hypothetical protein